MRKSNRNHVKRIAAFAAATTMCLSLSTGALHVSAATPETDNDIVLPVNIAITATDNNLYFKSTGVLKCMGATDVQGGYTAYVSVALQQKGSSWTSIKTWSHKGGITAVVDENYAVAKGYSYRLKLTHKAYDSNGNLIETITKYSEVINY